MVSMKMESLLCCPGDPDLALHFMNCLYKSYGYMSIWYMLLKIPWSRLRDYGVPTCYGMPYDELRNRSFASVRVDYRLMSAPHLGAPPFLWYILVISKSANGAVRQWRLVDCSNTCNLAQYCGHDKDLESVWEVEFLMNAFWMIHHDHGLHWVYCMILKWHDMRLYMLVPYDVLS